MKISFAHKYKINIDRGYHTNCKYFSLLFEENKNCFNFD